MFEKNNIVILHFHFEVYTLFPHDNTKNIDFDQRTQKFRNM